MSPAKIVHPRVEGALARQRLFEFLDGSPQSSIIWVSAPAGSGKTTLISSYLEARNLPGLWYQVDEGDEDIASFFYYLGLAAQAASGRQNPLPLLTPEYLANVPAFARRFFGELYNALPHPFALVFDNYQQAPPLAQIHEVLKEACRMLPERAKVFFISRHEPAPVLASFDLVEKTRFLTWNDIRFNLDEFREMARLQGWDSMDDRTLLRLYARTDGWVAGLLIMLEGLKKTGLGYNEVKNFSSEDLFGYFAGELFGSIMDRETRTFLMKTSVLPELSVSVVEELTGIRTAEQILGSMHRNHFFTERHGAVYQYHPLFREFLMFRLRETYGDDDILSLCRRAVALLEAEGKEELAAALVIEAAEWQLLKGIIHSVAGTLISQGRHSTLASWIDAAPQHIIEAAPWLCYWKGQCAFPFDTEAARQYWGRGYGVFKEQGDAEGLFLSWSAIVESIAYEWSDLNPLEHWIEEGEKLLLSFPSFPSREVEARFNTAMFSALAFAKPAHPQLPRYAERLYRVLVACPDEAQRPVLGYNLFLYHLVCRGDLNSSEYVLKASEPGTAPGQVPPLSGIVFLLMKASHLCMSCQFDDALATVEQGLALASSSKVCLMDHVLLAQGVYASVHAGDTKRARHYLERYKISLNPRRKLDASHAHYLAVLVCLVSHDRVRLDDESRQMLDTAISYGGVIQRGLAQLARAQALHELGEHDAASRHLAMGREEAISWKADLTLFHADICDALFNLDRGDVDACDKALRRALDLGRQRGYMNYPYWRRDVMTRLLCRALASDIEVPYVESLIRAHRLFPPAPDIEAWPWPVRIRTLGWFSIESNGKAIGSRNKSKFRLLGLLRAIIAFGGRQVCGHSLSDILWPESDGDAADNALGCTLHRLRKLLGSDSFILVQDGKVTLNPDYCWVDVWAFDHLAMKMEDLLGKGHAIPAPQLGLLCDELFRHYQGSFLADKNDEPWAAPLAEKLRRRFVRLVISCGREWEKQGEWDRAEECYQRGVEAEPSEELFRCLISSHIQRGFPSEAVRAYQLCCRHLSATLGVSPSPATWALIRDYVHVADNLSAHSLNL